MGEVLGAGTGGAASVGEVMETVGDVLVGTLVRTVAVVGAVEAVSVAEGVGYTEKGMGVRDSEGSWGCGWCGVRPPGGTIKTAWPPGCPAVWAHG